MHFWFDNWHPRSSMLSSYGLQAVYSMGLPIYARLSSVIHVQTGIGLLLDAHL